MSADQLENGDYAGTLVHEFTHFEEGPKEYADMMDFLQSDDITVDDGKGGRVKLWQSARDSVLSKDYGISEDQLSEILQKVDAGQEISEDEKRVYKTYATELVAHETETVLGNEQFIDKIIAENGTVAERLVSKIISLDKAFSSMKDKQSRGQAKLIRQAEGLYLKAAEAAGNKRIVKMILAHRPELEEELTRINAEKMQVGGETTNKSKMVNFDLKQLPNSDIKYTNISLEDIVSEDINEGDSWGRKARLYMRKRFNGIVLPVGKTKSTYIRKEGINEYTNPAKEIDNEVYREKMLASTELDNLLKASKYIGWSHDDGRHPDVLRWMNYETTFLVKDSNGTPQVLQGIVRIKRINRGDCFYDITKIKNITNGDIGQSIIKHAAESESDVLNNSISHSAEKSTENAKKVSGSEKNVQLDRKKKDNRVDSKGAKKYNKNIYYSQYNTLAMQWAFSSKTKPGDIKVLYNPHNNTWNKLIADDSEERYGTLLCIEDTPENAETITNIYNEVYNEDYREEQGIGESLRENYERYRNISSGSRDDNINAEEQNPDGHSRGVYTRESESDGERDTQQSSRDSRSIKFSLKSSYDTVNISRGTLAKIKANYKSDKVFSKNDVAKAINSIEAIAGIRAQLKNELVNRVWKGYNENLDAAGYEKFTEVMYHRIHATIMQETSFEMDEADIAKMDASDIFLAVYYAEEDRLLVYPNE